MRGGSEKEGTERERGYRKKRWRNREGVGRWKEVKKEGGENK